MGKLADIIRGKIGDITGKDDVQYNLQVNEMTMPSPVQTEIDGEAKATTAYFNRSWLGKVALQRGYVVNPDDKKVDGILATLNRKNGFCPCGGTGAQFKCPCQIMREYGICKCGLYLNVPDREVCGGNGASSGRIDK